MNNGVTVMHNGRTSTKMVGKMKNAFKTDMRTNHEIKKFRELIVGVNHRVPLTDGNYVTGINFDNAATTPPFTSVIKEITDFAPWYSSIHRGKGYKSVLSTELLEKSRETVGHFVHADPQLDSVIFTKNSTEAINLLAYVLHEEGGRPVVLASEMEHIANDLPWREYFTVDYIQVNQEGRLSLEDLEAKLKKYQGKVKLVTVTGASNVTGYINPIHQIAKLAHFYGTKIHVDGAQLVPHKEVNMKEYTDPEHIDFLSFTGHKMYAPFGVGVLIGAKATFNQGKPLLKGGGAVRIVSQEFVQWDEAPEKDEAGTPNIMGIVALSAAIRTFQQLDMDSIHEYEKNLLDYTLDGLQRIPDIKIYGAQTDKEPHVSLFSFSMEEMNHHDIAQILSDDFGIAVRSGFFCAHPYVQRLLGLSEETMEQLRDDPSEIAPGLVRVSFSFYNTHGEIDVLLQALKEISNNKEYYTLKYMSNTKGVCGTLQDSRFFASDEV
jgi:cysteine desulfurase/selenocysteine lyase